MWEGEPKGPPLGTVSPSLNPKLSSLAILPSQASCHTGNGEQVGGVEHMSTQLRISPSVIRPGRELRKDTL